MLVLHSSHIKSNKVNRYSSFLQQRGDAGFEKAYQQCVVACDAFLKKALANEI